MAPFSFSGLFFGDGGIYQTVYKIREAVHFAVRQLSVRRLAEEIVSGCRERSEYEEVNCIFNWVSGHYRFLRDPRGLELVKSPEVSVEEIKEKGFLQGDCDDVTALMCALLKVIGYPVRAIIIAPPGKGAFQHIYLEVWMSKDRQWLPLDVTARGREIGWSAPSDRKRSYEI